MSKTNQFDEALAAEKVSGPLAALARSIYTQESSGGKNTQTSNRGAVGGMQVTPGAFSDVADKGWSITDPMHNLRAGIRYLKKMDVKSGGVPELTAAGYYGGAGGLEKARRGVAVSDPKNPKAPNTLEYGQQVVARMGGEARQSTPVAPVPSQVLVGGGVPAIPADVVPVMAQAPIQLQAEAPVMAQAPVAPVMEMGPDAWQAFLQTMPQQAQQPVNVGDIDYANPRLATSVPQFQYQPTVDNSKPTVAAFSGWGSQAPQRSAALLRGLVPDYTGRVA